MTTSSSRSFCAMPGTNRRENSPMRPNSFSSLLQVAVAGRSYIVMFAKMPITCKTHHCEVSEIQAVFAHLQQHVLVVVSITCHFQQLLEVR